jgi:selenocysteine lyase/cysteine desulfurase
VRLHTPLSGDVSAGIISFEVDGVAPGQVVERLRQRKVIASVTPRSYGVDYARLSPSLLTSPADVEAALRAVREIV